VTASPSGGVWVVGSTWDATLASHTAVAAWWDGQAWNEVAGLAGGTELHDVVGSLDTDGWAVGRSGLQSSVARVCLPERASIFGADEPSPRLPPSDELASRRAGEVDGAVAAAASAATRPASTVAQAGSAVAAAASTVAQAAGPVADAAGTATGTSTTGDAARSSSLAARRDRDDRPKAKRKAASKASKAKARARRGPAGLPTAQADPRIIARDVAREVGLAELTATYGAVVADFDADGVDDLFIGRHGRPARLVLDRDGHFVDHAPMVFPGIDRHGCSAADIDGSGLPDLYCAIGGKRGSGLKSNELWLDPGGPAPLQVAVERGLSDPTGRGRRAVFLESERGPEVDLVVTNSPVRVDGLPSLGHVLRTTGDGLFSTRRRPGFAARLGSLAMQDADYDGDGREDLLLVTGGPQAPRQQGTRLYRNTPRGLVDVTRQTRIRPFGEIDAELVDLDHDSKLDLVQLSPTRLRVSKLHRGRFRPVYTRALTEGRAITAGDINGDGKDDLYIVRADGDRNIPDVMLVNRDAGSAWSALAIPQAASGRGDDAVVIDHDGNGLEDFVVLNGNNARGPVQLIAFFPRTEATG
jgi:hypothetical protein